MKIELLPGLSVDEDELIESFIRASGPGGQNVNKVSTAVELRFDLAHSPSIPDDIRARALRIAGHRLTQGGTLIIKAQRFRTQDRNRADAREQLVSILQASLYAPKPRRPTKPTKSARAKRTDSKIIRGRIKQARGRVRNED